jgi:hypothetical protein
MFKILGSFFYLIATVAYWQQVSEVGRVRSGQHASNWNRPALGDVFQTGCTLQKQMKILIDGNCFDKRVI